jgi:hypothetical protein
MSAVGPSGPRRRTTGVTAFGGISAAPAFSRQGLLCNIATDITLKPSVGFRVCCARFWSIPDHETALARAE